MTSSVETINSLRSEKRIHEMDRLSDIIRLPASVFLITGINSALTVFITSLVHKHHWELYFMLLWLAGALTANLLPIAVARLAALRGSTNYPAISGMKLSRDFYKLSDWVYLVPAINLGFWIVFSWTVLTYRNIPATVPLLLASAFLCALFPLCARLLLVFSGHRRA